MKQKTVKLVLDIKTKIRTLMVNNNLSQHKLADKMDTSQQAINNLLNNSKDIKITDMVKAANALNVEFTDLLPQSIIQNNNEGTKENIQIQNLNINNTKLLEILIEKQEAQNELFIQILTILKREKE